jgi:hypothetical protein
MKNELMQIPSIGVSLSRDLNSLGIKSVKDLKDADAEKLYEKLCKIHGKHIDRCVLYAFRCAVYYASNRKHNPDKLKWWNWKD